MCEFLQRASEDRGPSRARAELQRRVLRWDALRGGVGEGVAQHGRAAQVLRDRMERHVRISTGVKQHSFVAGVLAMRAREECGRACVQGSEAVEGMVLRLLADECRARERLMRGADEVPAALASLTEMFSHHCRLIDAAHQQLEDGSLTKPTLGERGGSTYWSLAAICAATVVVNFVCL